MRIDFTNRVVIVTGATRGIGRTIAEYLYKAGATLLLTGTDPQQIRQLNARVKNKKRIRYLALDFRNEYSVRQFLNEIKKYKKIDACINNAGTNRINYIDDFPVADWDEIIKVNLTGPFLLMKEAAKIMKRRYYGRIVNISSIFGVVGKAKRAAYSAAKAGLIGLTRTAAVDLAPYNVLVNSVSPGFVLTDLTKRILNKKDISQIKSFIPMGRLGRPEDIAPIVLFLASELNTYITGQNIVADGGYVSI